MRLRQRCRIEGRPLNRWPGAAARLLLPLACLAPGAAQAQWSGAVALLSDYRVRGLSLSAQRPAAQARLAYDGTAGWYGGAQAALVRVGQAHTQWTAYAGHAVRLPAGLSIDLGVSAVRAPHASRYDYDEAYAGLSADRAGARLSLSPAYGGAGIRSAYAEAHAFQPLGSGVTLFVHGGLLRLHGAARGAGWDVRAGIDIAAGDCTLQLAWVAARSAYGYGHTQALLGSTTFSF